jgi:TonB family protein
MRGMFLIGVGVMIAIGPAFGGTDQPAQPIARPIPDYPTTAGAAEGYVKLRFTVGKDGHVADAAVVESNPPGVFDAAALAGVKQWTFRPRLIDGQPADQPNIPIMIRFKPPADTGPVWLHPRAPLYPREAFAAKLEGKVTVGFDLDATGTTSNVHIVDSSPPGVFDQSSIIDVQNRHYQPAIVGGQPQAAPNQTAVIEYRLAEARVRPKLLYAVRPSYPALAEDWHANGYCDVELTIADDGSVTALIEQSFPHEFFDESCKSAVEQWKFESRAEVGAAMTDHLYYRFNFRLQGETEKDVHYLRPGQWIIVDFTQTKDGHAKDIKVVEQSQPDLPTRKAIEQMRNMKFTPILENGVPIEKEHVQVKIQ